MLVCSASKIKLEGRTFPSERPAEKAPRGAREREKSEEPDPPRPDGRLPAPSAAAAALNSRQEEEEERGTVWLGDNSTG